MKAVLLDVEGTTTPVAFVYERLFPYARTRVEGFLRASWEDPEVRAEARALMRECPGDGGVDAVRAAARCARALIDADRKSTPLKSLQGRIWEDGYRSGALVGEVYPDVPDALARWRAAGVRVCIYSSGSAQAQRLLFAHSTAGDLTVHIERHFDTTVGPKREPRSYARIASALALEPGDVTFVSDVSAELEAARAAGMRAVLCARPDVAAARDAGWEPAVADFDDPVVTAGERTPIG